MSSEPTLHLYYYLKDITALKVLPERGLLGEDSILWRVHPNK